MDTHPAFKRLARNAATVTAVTHYCPSLAQLSTGVAEIERLAAMDSDPDQFKADVKDLHESSLMSLTDAARETFYRRFRALSLVAGGSLGERAFDEARAGRHINDTDERS